VLVFKSDILQNFSVQDGGDYQKGYREGKDNKEEYLYIGYKKHYKPVYHKQEDYVCHKVFHI